MSYFYTEINGTDLEVVNRRVAELIGRGFEVHKRNTDHNAVSVYKHTNAIGRSKRKFESREDRTKYSVVMRRANREKAQA